MKNKYFAVYACDMDEKGMRVGPETSARLEKFLELIQKETETINVVFLGAGRRTPLTKRMATLMHGYIGVECTRRSIPLPTVATANRQAWGSLDESIQIRNIAYAGKVTHLTIVSSGYHIPRLKLIWWLICPKMRITWIPVKVRRKKIDFLEPVKMVWAVVKFLLYKCRIRESYLFIAE